MSEVKKQVKAKTGIDPDSQRLIYGGKQMEDEKQLCEYKTIGHGATIYLVLRLPGGSAQSSLRHIDRKLPRSKEPCMITFEDDCSEFPVFVLPCGHSISPDGLMDYCWNEISSCKPEIRCPLCNQEWPIEVISKYGCATHTEIHELENGLSKNFCLNDPSILECPNCTSFCERRDTTKLCVQCIVCSKKKAKYYHFCWQCLGEWKNKLSADTCGNSTCGDPVFLRQLATAPMITPMGMKVQCPKIRACPNCGTVIDLSSGCKHMTCKSCKQDFCFVCLRTKSSGSWSCGSYNTQCAPAPRQTRIPQRTM